MNLTKHIILRAKTDDLGRPTVQLRPVFYREFTAHILSHFIGIRFYASKITKTTVYRVAYQILRVDSTKILFKYFDKSYDYFL